VPARGPIGKDAQAKVKRMMAPFTRRTEDEKREEIALAGMRIPPPKMQKAMVSVSA